MNSKFIECSKERDEKMSKKSTKNESTAKNSQINQTTEQHESKSVQSTGAQKNRR